MNSKSDIKKIAFADDHNAVREGITRCIEEGKKMKVTMKATNGQEMLDMLLLSDELPDACLIDINMPVMNGIVLLKEIKKRWPGLPCIILSAFDHEYDVIELIKAGANGFMLKTCTPEELKFAIKKVIAKGFYYNETINKKKIEEIANSKTKPVVLNEREIEFIKLICSDLSYADIAVQCGTTFKTIDGIRSRLFEKLQVNSRVGLVLSAIKLGYYTIENGALPVDEITKNRLK